MKTVRQIMAETNALDNVELMKQMMAWPYEHKVRHAEEVARAFWQRNTEEGRNLHVSVGGLDSITLHYFLQEIGVLVPCISCSTLEQKGMQMLCRHRSPQHWQEPTPQNGVQERKWPRWLSGLTMWRCKEAVKWSREYSPSFCHSSPRRLTELPGVARTTTGR